MKESVIQQLCRLEAAKCGAVVWRNNTGKLQDREGRWVSYGLCVGSSDLIGIYKGRFLAIEVKRDGKNPTPEQLNFLRVVEERGGIAGVVRSPEDVKKLLTSIP
ncbi:MAG: VRR-NUC domain-containing protein [Leptolyngbyaceae bacterium]|nr:VRR-NUC domain-containing protein [Leptolyngbyaceae bacterium]